MVSSQIQNLEELVFYHQPKHFPELILHNMYIVYTIKLEDLVFYHQERNLALRKSITSTKNSRRKDLKNFKLNNEEENSDQTTKFLIQKRLMIQFISALLFKFMAASTTLSCIAILSEISANDLRLQLISAFTK